MNYFDNEENIIKIFQKTFKKDVYFPFQSRKCMKIFNSVYKGKYWEKWIDNSGKSNPPPDFFSEELGLMMEVMRVDDHAHYNEKGILVNPVNRLESIMQKEIRQKIQLSRPDIDLSKVSVYVNAISGLPSNEDHNYRFYYNNFERIINKHIENIPLYRKNHPNKKLIFFIFDESTGYLMVDDEKLVERGPIALENFFAVPLWHFYDKRFISIFKESDIDYVIWYTPYKVFHGSPIQPPKVCVFDIKEYKSYKMFQYPEKFIISSEA